LIVNNGTNFRFLSNEEINKKLENLTKSLDFDGNPIYSDSAIDFGLISALHTLSDSFVFRDSHIKNIVFSRDKLDAIYGFSFDQGSMSIENNKIKKLDFDLVDSYFVSGEIS
jgi:hypothetical protein